MKERPILFSGEMIRALLSGNKTQTRRIVKPRKDRNFGVDLVEHELAGEINAGDFTNCSVGQPGDGLWVRETFQGPLVDEDEIASYHEEGPDKYLTPEFCKYRATDQLDAIDFDGNELGWRPSIHMPRWASRITLEIVNVRVEQLQDISIADAQAEGIFFKDYGRNCFHGGSWPKDVGECPAPFASHPQREGWSWKETTSHEQCHGNARYCYGALWESINGAGSWNKNPWVWVVEFKVVKA